MRCNGAFRFDELVAFAERAGADEVWTGHYARIVERDGVKLVGKARDARKDQSYMLAAVDPTLLERVRFPLGDQTKEETRAEAAALGLAAARRAESQEACFLGGDDYRAFLERQGLHATRGPVVDLDGATIGEHDGYWRFTPGQRRGVRVAANRPLYVLRNRRDHEHRDRRPARAPRGTRRRGTGQAVPAGGPGRREAALSLRSRSRRRRRRPRTASRSSSTSPRTASHAVRWRCVYDDDAVVGAGVITAVDADASRISAMTVLAVSSGDVLDYALAAFFVVAGAGLAYMLIRMGGTFARLSSFISGAERDVLPVVVKAGGTVDRVNDQIDKLDTVTDSAVAMADSADTAVRAVSTAITTPVKKVSGLAAGVSHGFSAFRARRDAGEAVRVAKETAARRESELDDELRNAGQTRPESAAAGRVAAAGRSRPRS